MCDLLMLLQTIVANKCAQSLIEAKRWQLRAGCWKKRPNQQQQPQSTTTTKERACVLLVGWICSFDCLFAFCLVHYFGVDKVKLISLHSFVSATVLVAKRAMSAAKCYKIPPMCGRQTLEREIELNGLWVFAFFFSSSSSFAFAPRLFGSKALN